MEFIQSTITGIVNGIILLIGIIMVYRIIKKRNDGTNNR